MLMWGVSKSRDGSDSPAPFKDGQGRRWSRSRQMWLFAAGEVVELALHGLDLAFEVGDLFVRGVAGLLAGACVGRRCRVAGCAVRRSAAAAHQRPKGREHAHRTL